MNLGEGGNIYSVCSRSLWLQCQTVMLEDKLAKIRPTLKEGKRKTYTKSESRKEWWAEGQRIYILLVKINFSLSSIQCFMLQLSVRLPLSVTSVYECHMCVLPKCQEALKDNASSITVSAQLLSRGPGTRDGLIFLQILKGYTK